MQQMADMQYPDGSTTRGYIDGRKTRISVLANQSVQNLTATKAELETLIQDPSLSEGQKKEINKYLTKIQQIQNEFQKAVQQAQMANNAQLLDNINNQVEALAGMTQELLNMIPEMLKLLIQEAEQGEGTDVTESDPAGPESTTGDTSHATQPTVQIVAPEGSNPEDSLLTTTNKKVSQEVIEIAEEIFTAVDGVGLSNSALKAAVEKINKDNVLDLFDHWNAAYAPNYINTDKQGLIETIYGEHYLSSGKEEITHILNALIEKATTMGGRVLQDINPLKVQINTELNAWFNTNEDKVAENINKIVLILNAYQAEQSGNTTKKTS